MSSDHARTYRVAKAMCVSTRSGSVVADNTCSAPGTGYAPRPSCGPHRRHASDLLQSAWLALCGAGVRGFPASGSPEQGRLQLHYNRSSQVCYLTKYSMCLPARASLMLGVWWSPFHRCTQVHSLPVSPFICTRYGRGGP